MKQHVIDIFIRMSETNASKHVSNTSYFLYLDEARDRFFEKVGYGSQLAEKEVSFVLAEVTCTFLQESFYGQSLQVLTDVKRIGTKSFTLQHEIIDKHSKAIIASAQSIVVCIAPDKKETKRIPQLLQNKLEYMKNAEYISNERN